jgi:hypothetical protein
MFAGMNRAKRILFGALAAVLGIGVAFYAAEVVFRHVLLVPSIPESAADFQRLIADQWPRSIAVEKKPGTVRILGLADSFGVAGGADNYHYRLEAILRERGHDVEVVNLSVPAYSLEHELQLLRRFGARYEPDVVLHAFFVGNDFGLGEPPSLRYSGIDIKRMEGFASWLPHNLALLRWLPKWSHARAEQRRQSADQEQGLGQGSFSHATFLNIERVRFGACRRPRTDGPAWPGTTAVLDGLRQAVRELNAGHVLVVHPDQFQVEEELAEEIVNTFDLDPRQYDLDLPQRFLEAYASSRDIPLVDLTPVFRERGRQGGLYLPRDSHYNEAGNLLAAERLADALEPVVVEISGVSNRVSSP